MVRLWRAMNGYRVAATGPQTQVGTLVAQISCLNTYFDGFWWMMTIVYDIHLCMRNLSSSFNINTFITTLSMQSKPGGGDDGQVQICIDCGYSAFEYFHSRSEMMDVGGFLMSSHQSSIEYVTNCQSLPAKRGSTMHSRNTPLAWNDSDNTIKSTHIHIEELCAKMRYHYFEFPITASNDNHGNDRIWSGRTACNYCVCICMYSIHCNAHEHVYANGHLILGRNMELHINKLTRRSFACHHTCWRIRCIVTAEHRTGSSLSPVFGFELDCSYFYHVQYCIQHRFVNSPSLAYSWISL